MALKIDSRHGAVPDPLAIVAHGVELKRWQRLLFTLFRTTASTTGSYVTTMGTSSATIPPEKPPNWSSRRSCESAATSSLFTSLTEERAARFLQRGEQRDCPGDEQMEPADVLSNLHAVDMLAGPRQKLRQRHDPRLARNLPTVVHQHQRRYALDAEALQQFRHRIAFPLDQPHVRLELGCRPFEDRRHRPAGTAPGCPEINEQRNVAVVCMPVEASGAVQCSRSPFVKRQMAGPALTALAQSFARHTVDRVAMGTDDVQRAGHVHSGEALDAAG